MENWLDEAITILGRTPAVLDALLRDLPARWTLVNEGESSWSAFDVVGHLIHCERTDWLPRARVVLEFGEGEPFPAFDRFGHVRAVAGKTLRQLLDEFAQVRRENLEALRSLGLTPEHLHRRGRHPSLGPVTLGELLAAWAAHDLNHLHQIARVMAHQCRDAVGPWERYLGVMHCTGHGAAS